MHHVLIIAAGGIGRRHMQACSLLDHEQYSIHVVEPDKDNRKLAEQMWNEAITGRTRPCPQIHIYNNISQVKHGRFSVAIIATQAANRLEVLKEILARKKFNNLMLEKVLFQKVNEYDDCLKLINEHSIETWVNCPRRMWTPYKELKQVVRSSISRISVTGDNWDIGCNGVHFIDLFAYLADSDRISLHSINLDPEPIPSRRAGMLHVRGTFKGDITVSDRKIPFILSSSEKNFSGYEVTVELQGGEEYLIKEGRNNVLVQSRNASVNMNEKVFDMPYQSALTNIFVENASQNLSVDLPVYNDTMNYHRNFIESLMEELRSIFPEKISDSCPVT